MAQRTLQHLFLLMRALYNIYEGQWTTISTVFHLSKRKDGKQLQSAIGIKNKEDVDNMTRKIN